MSAESPVCQEVASDPLSPPAPQPPYFDPALDAWVLSRYLDVLAAFREPRLWPVSPQSKYRPETYDEAEQAQTRTETLAALSSARITAWRAEIESQAGSILSQLPTNRCVDLVREFAQPWSLSVASIVTGTDTADSRHLVDLAYHVSASAADPYDAVLKSRAKWASAELEKSFQKSAMPMASAAFVALSQTLPCLLANAWLVLLRSPAAFAQLHAQSDLTPRAIEELLRCACLPRVLFRRATATVNVGNVTIGEGERVILMLASANRDPVQFPDPNRVDLTRHAVGHFTLGTGLHACVGALLIRVTMGAATGAFVREFVAASTDGLVEWQGGFGFYSPLSLNALLQRD
jgi:cytochrome P450